MNKDYYNQRISCHVTNCSFYDNKEKRCGLGSITVGSDNAICETYEKKNDYK